MQLDPYFLQVFIYYKGRGLIRGWSVLTTRSDEKCHLIYLLVLSTFFVANSTKRDKDQARMC